jgi:thiol-disulfide isomerase/thioredoxin
MSPNATRGTLIGVAIIGLLLGFLSQQYPSAVTHTAHPLDKITLPDLSNTPRSLADWAGKKRVINFWATWCPPCRKEIPALITLQNNSTTNNVQVISIAIEDQQSVQSFLKDYPINFPVLIAGDDGITLSTTMGNRANAVPFTVFIDEDGAIQKTHAGEISLLELQELIHTN